MRYLVALIAQAVEERRFARILDERGMVWCMGNEDLVREICGDNWFSRKTAELFPPSA